MDSYNGFAYVYDTFMNDLPYEEWADFFEEKLIENGAKCGCRVLDMGCGTGIFTRLLREKGFCMTGMDLSSNMLEIAKQDDLSINYFKGDMSSFELSEKMDAIVSACDSVNYLIEENAFVSMVKSAYEGLKTKGILMFDLKTEEFFRDELGFETFSECATDCAYIWENCYDEDSMINEYGLTVFVEDDNGKYDRYDEIHRQRAYKEEFVLNVLRDAGFTKVEKKVLDLDGTNLERIYFVACK